MPAKSIRKRSFVKDAALAKPGLLIGYARVSRGDDQNNVLQTKALKAAGCRRLFEETASGGRAGRMMMQMFGAFAEFERAMIRERTSAGLTAARAEGRIVAQYRTDLAQSSIFKTSGNST